MEWNMSHCQKISSALAANVHRGEVAGAVVLAALKGEIVQLEAAGWGDLATKRLMKANDLFWVASMTKPITAAAVLRLADEGRLSIDDPVGKYLPVFKDQWVVRRQDGKRMVLGRPMRPVTLRHLLSHTHGMQEPPRPPAGSPLAAWALSGALLPLRVEPGSEWKYGNIGSNTLAWIVEMVSGQPFEEFLRNRFFEPLEMRDTTFYPDSPRLRRLASSYLQPLAGGTLEKTGIASLNSEPGSPRVTVHAGGGLFSTAVDMYRFYQMLLNGGRLDGRRYLRASTVSEMTRPQTGDMTAGFSAGMRWGLGVWIVGEPQGVTDVFPIGTFGHDGAYGTSVIAIPKKNLLLIMMTQRKDRENGTGPGFLEIRREFVVTAMAVLSGQASVCSNAGNSPVPHR